MWGAAAPLIPEWSQRLDLSSFEAGVLLASASLTIFAVSLPASWLGTRFGSRHVTLAAVGLLVVAIAEMSAVGRPYYERVKEAIEVRPSGVPRRSDEELDEILRSPIGLWNTVFGIAVLAAIAWLMIFKPFVVL